MKFDGKNFAIGAGSGSIATVILGLAAWFTARGIKKHKQKKLDAANAQQKAEK